MPFATEQDLRKEAFFDDMNEVPSAAILDCLQRAHDEILAGTTLTDASTVNLSIVRAESMLSLSHYFRSLALQNAVSAQDVKTTMLRLNEHTRVEKWMSLSQSLWEEAWRHLRPYLRITPPRFFYITEGRA